MKHLILIYFLFSISIVSHTQTHEGSLKLLALNRSNYKQTPIKGSTSTYSEKKTPNVNIVLGYTLSKQNKYDVNISYGIFKNTSSSFNDDLYRKQTFKQSSIWQHISLSCGKRFYYNKYLIISSIGIPFEIITSDKQTINIDRFDQSNNIIGTTSNYHTRAPVYSTGVFLNQGFYYNLISKIYIGFDLRIGLSINKLKGKDESNTVDIYNGKETITNQSLNLNLTSYSLPLMSNIGIRYIFKH